MNRNVQRDHHTRPWHLFFADPPKLALAGQPIKLALFQISRRCPYVCHYCYRNTTVNGPIVPYHSVGTMIDRLRYDGWNVFPLMAELIPEIEPYLPYWQRCGADEISTAGDPLVERPAWFDILKHHAIDGVRITVFPTDDLHVAWTGRQRATALQAVKIAVANDFHVTWNFLLSRQTRPYVRLQIDEAIRIGAHRFHLNLFFPGGRGWSLRDEMLTPEELFAVKQEYVHLKKTHRATITLTRNGLMGPSPDAQTISAQLATSGKFCLAGRGDHGQMIFIDADLRVYGCLMQIDPVLCIGTIAENGELIFNENNPLFGFDRKDCFMMQYLRTLNEARKNSELIN